MQRSSPVADDETAADIFTSLEDGFDFETLWRVRLPFLDRLIFRNAGCMEKDPRLYKSVCTLLDVTGGDIVLLLSPGETSPNTQSF